MDAVRCIDLQTLLPVHVHHFVDGRWTEVQARVSILRGTPRVADVRLQNDQIWNVEVPPSVTLSFTSSGDPLKTELLEHNIAGGFSEEVLRAFEAEPSLVNEIAHIVLSEHFPPEDHARIRRQVGLIVS